MAKVMINNVRLAFPSLFEAKAFGDSEPAFSASFIITPDNPAKAQIEEAIRAVAKEKWAAKADQVLKDLVKSDKVCLRNGDDKSQYDGFEGNLYVAARSTVRPTVIDGQKNPLTQADGKPYAGCYVNASIEVWAQDNKYGKRINATLKGVQFRRDGDAFGAGSAASADEFETVDDNDDFV